MNASDLVSRTVVEMTEEEYTDHVEMNDGICLACKEFRCGDCEPDASSYKCEECGAREVKGMELALLDGNIEFTDNDSDDDEEEGDEDD